MKRAIKKAVKKAIKKVKEKEDRKDHFVSTGEEFEADFRIVSTAGDKS